MTNKPKTFHVEQLLDAIDTRLERLEKKTEQLERDYLFLRSRVALLLPENAHCPYCKAKIHKDSKNCGTCGRSWGKPPNPRAGLPR